MSKKDFFLALIVTLIWGANYSVIELGLQQLDPLLLTAFRFTMCWFPLCFFVKKPKVPIGYVAAYGTIFGVGLWGIANMAMQVGLPAGISSLLLQFSAFFTIIWSIILFKDDIKYIQYFGMLIAMIGLIMVVHFTDANKSTLGCFLIIIAAVCWSICNVIVKKCKPQQMVAFIIWSSMFSAIPLFIITYIIHGDVPFLQLHSSLNSTTIFSILFQSYITTLFGYWVWNMLIKKYNATSIVPISLLIPIFGIITSHIMFNEKINLIKVVSTMVVLFGMLLLLYGTRIQNIFKRFIYFV